MNNLIKRLEFELRLAKMSYKETERKMKSCRKGDHKYDYVALARVAGRQRQRIMSLESSIRYHREIRKLKREVKSLQNKQKYEKKRKYWRSKRRRKGGRYKKGGYRKKWRK